ncbi:MATH domain-containing protein [Caenorhabditis elegans]|uniref:MATH domain-containing protein n=1 Tax=Caenorhabditis elegans TaxID=6239 RepID=O16556_CAEEL|nr:MATH domain-containing protein [Caenorhabditis elegans]CCD64680.1 MATH domain-containing protein [Caenorhabditis elegans]|eukprot:NP_494106.3 MATH (meprin-associated Traf homology) domain containing [Caenorhabditis elegans]
MDFFSYYLRCEKEECENKKWSIETEFTLKLVSHNGKSLMKSGKYTFEKADGFGWFIFISWNDLESDYVVNDSIVVEAHVKIIKINDSPCIDSQCIENESQKIFLLNHTVENVSSIREGGYYFTKTEKRFNIPWRLKIERRNGFFGLYIWCDKEQSNRRDWTIDMEQDLRLVSLNGQSLSLKGTCTFKEARGSGWEQFLRWDDMEKKYMVNDSIIIEARVKIIKMTGCEEDSTFSLLLFSLSQYF